jgi:C4-dicarboxylate-specific signal transduction histidine kinase
MALKIRAVQHMALHPMLVRAVRRQNAENISPAEIAERDRAWRDSNGLTEIMWSMQQSKAGRVLRRRVEEDDALNEAFLTDGQGANVAAFPPTSDYFQGDEEKWSESFNGGAGRIFLGPIEHDESTGVDAVQVSAPVIDNGRTIGVLVVGVQLDYIERQQGSAVR